MGCGSGIVSIFCSSIGAKCTAADINPQAVKTAKENAGLNGFEKEIEVIESDLFENIKGKYDIIFFNPPYYPKEPANDFEKAFNAGNDYRILKEFASCVGEHLKEEGIIYLIISSDINPAEFKIIFAAKGLSIEVIKEHKKFFETFYIIKTLANNTR
jgi:release factor glutamine methyltransferase